MKPSANRSHDVIADVMATRCSGNEMESMKCWNVNRLELAVTAIEFRAFVNRAVVKTNYRRWRQRRASCATFNQRRSAWITDRNLRSWASSSRMGETLGRRWPGKMSWHLTRLLNEMSNDSTPGCTFEIFSGGVAIDRDSTFSRNRNLWNRDIECRMILRIISLFCNNTFFI